MLSDPTEADKERENERQTQRQNERQAELETQRMEERENEKMIQQNNERTKKREKYWTSKQIDEQTSKINHEQANKQTDEQVNYENVVDNNETAEKQQDTSTIHVNKKEQTTFTDDIRRIKTVARMWGIDVSETPDTMANPLTPTSCFLGCTYRPEFTVTVTSVLSFSVSVFGSAPCACFDVALLELMML